VSRPSRHRDAAVGSRSKKSKARESGVVRWPIQSVPYEESLRAHPGVSRRGGGQIPACWIPTIPHPAYLPPLLSRMGLVHTGPASGSVGPVMHRGGRHSECYPLVALMSGLSRGWQGRLSRSIRRSLTPPGSSGASWFQPWSLQAGQFLHALERSAWHDVRLINHFIQPRRDS
jgi:hypothetical protein